MERPWIPFLVLLLGQGCGSSPEPCEGTTCGEDGGMVDGGDERSDGGDAGPGWVLDPRDPVEPIPTVDPGSFELPEWPAGAPGDLLISEAGRGCLSAAAPAVPGSEVGVGTCRGTAGQRWALVDGSPRPASATTLCLDADGPWGSGMFLTECAELSSTFAMQPDGVIEREGVAMDVTSDFRLTIYGTHRRDNQRWRWLQEDVDFLAANTDHVVSYPFGDTDTLSYEVEEARHRVGTVQPPYPELARDVSAFPGEVAADAPMVSRRVHLDRRFDHETDYLGVAWPPQHWQSTGLYAPAGRVLVVDVPEGTDTTGLFVRINIHTDELTPTSSNVQDGTFDRMPRVALRVALEPGPNAVRSPYGGTVILQSTADVDVTVPIEIHGAVAMPRFVLGVTAPEEWAERRTLGAPWAELEGDRAVITVPAEKVRELLDPAPVMRLYDRVVELEVDLFALDSAAGPTSPHRMYSGKARFVEDVQITGGWGHSGFPVMTHYGWELADLGAEGDEWGVWHELGHNHQQFCLWSSRFGTESTVNLFSLYVQGEITGEDRIADRYDGAISAVAGGLTFDEADVWQKLVFLVQPVLALADGWELYRRVHRAYREMDGAQRANICDSEQRQIDTFYRLLSEAGGVDLRDHFLAWGVPVSAAGLDAVAALDLPDPPVTVQHARP